MTNCVYVLTKEGVFSHGIQAVITSKKKAIATAIDIAKLEHDNYHSIAVTEVQPNLYYWPRPENDDDSVGYFVGFANKESGWTGAS